MLAIRFPGSSIERRKNGENTSMADGQPIAHVAEDGRVHGLEEYLRETARRAGEFAAAFGCGEWGRYGWV
jgi:hypothetical protein